MRETCWAMCWGGEGWWWGRTEPSLLPTTSRGRLNCKVPVYTTQSVCIVPSWYEPSWKVVRYLCLNGLVDNRYLTKVPWNRRWWLCVVKPSSALLLPVPLFVVMKTSCTLNPSGSIKIETVLRMLGQLCFVDCCHLWSIGFSNVAYNGKEEHQSVLLLMRSATADRRLLSLVCYKLVSQTHCWYRNLAFSDFPLILLFTLAERIWTDSTPLMAPFTIHLWTSIDDTANRPFIWMVVHL